MNLPRSLWFDLGTPRIILLRSPALGSEQASINTEYIAKVLRITKPANVDLTPYDDKLLQVQDILQILGPDHEIRSKESSIGTA